MLVSHDVNTVPSHFRTYRDAGRSSAGVFLIPQTLSLATAIDELLMIWMITDAGEWENRVVWLPI